MSTNHKLCADGYTAGVESKIRRIAHATNVHSPRSRDRAAVHFQSACCHIRIAGVGIHSAQAHGSRACFCEPRRSTARRVLKGCRYRECAARDVERIPIQMDAAVCHACRGDGRSPARRYRALQIERLKTRIRSAVCMQRSACEIEVPDCRKESATRQRPSIEIDDWRRSSRGSSKRIIPAKRHRPGIDDPGVRIARPGRECDQPSPSIPMRRAPEVRSAVPRIIDGVSRRSRKRQCRNTQSWSRDDGR